MSDILKPWEWSYIEAKGEETEEVFVPCADLDGAKLYYVDILSVSLYCHYGIDEYDFVIEPSSEKGHKIWNAPGKTIEEVILKKMEE